MDHKGSLFLGQELGRLGEVVHQEKGRDGDQDGDDALEDEDPSPPLQPCCPVHLADGKGQETAECAGDGGCAEEERLAELNLVSAVPHGEVVLISLSS